MRTWKVRLGRLCWWLALGLVSGILGAAEPADEACLKCHTPIEKALKRKHRHAAVDMGCATCHLNHQDAAAQKGKTEHYLNDAVPALCVNCHDVKDKAIAGAHKGQPFEAAACQGCHDPHASDGAKLLPEFAHSAYGPGQCDSCHQGPKDGKVVLGAASVSALCFGCHGELEEKLKKSKAKHSLLASDADACTTCHNPHGSRHPKALKEAPVAVCSSCHADVTAEKKFVHRPVSEACTLCHDAHASDHPKQLHASRGEVCLACHDAKALGKFTGAEPVTLFGDKVKLPAKPYEGLKMLELRGGRSGHPMPNHPTIVEDKEGKPGFDCVSCHKPHAANGSEQLLDTDTAVSSPLCIRCHK